MERAGRFAAEASRNLFRSEKQQTCGFADILSAKESSREVRKVRKGTIDWRLRFGGSTSSSTAGVLACQWINVPKTILVQYG